MRFNDIVDFARKSAAIFVFYALKVNRTAIKSTENGQNKAILN